MSYIYDYNHFLEAKKNNQLNEITNVYLHRESIHESLFQEIFTSCPNITHLNIELHTNKVPKEIERLQKLSDLILWVQDTNQLPDFSTIKSLEKLIIHSKKDLSNINLQSIEKLSRIELNCDNKISNLSLLNAPNLKVLVIYAHQVDHHELEVLSSFLSLDVLNIKFQNTKKIPSIHAPNLRSYYIEGDEIESISDFSDCENIKYISFKTPKLKECPSIVHCKKLSNIELESNNADFPIFPSEPTHYDSILINNFTMTADFPAITTNQLKLSNIDKLEELPNFGGTNVHTIEFNNLPNLQNLASLNLDECKQLYYLTLRNIPLEVISEVNRPSKIEYFNYSDTNSSLTKDFEVLTRIKPKNFRVDSFLVSKSDKVQKKVDRFISSLASSKLSLDDKKYFFEYFFPIFSKNSTKKSDFSKTEIFKLGLINNTDIKKIVNELTFSKIEEDLAKSPISANIKIAVVGTTGTKKTEYKNKFKEINIEYHTKVTKDTTHIIIGKNVKDFTLSEELNWVSEQAITSYLNDKSTPYLLEEEENNTENLKNIQSLLLAGEDNALLGLELLSSGGVPQESLLHLLIAQKTDTNKKVKDKARKLLLANAGLDYEKALTDRGRFTSTKSEKDLSKHLKTLHKKAPGIDWLEFANLYLQKTGKGHRFIFDFAKKENPTRQRIFNEICQGDHLDLYKTLIKEVPDFMNYYSVESFFEEKIPEEVFERITLTSLSLKGFCLISAPKELTKLQKLKTLDLSFNRLKSLSNSLLSLTNLEELILDENEIINFPTNITILKNLKKVSLKRMRKLSEFDYVKLEVPEEVQNALPNCEFIVE